MTASTATRPEIAAFADAVRAALADLPQEDVDDLTDGLEADLSERADDAAPDAWDFGDPDLYAEELRAAAGLPDRGAAPRAHWSGRSTGESVRALGRRTAAAVRSTTLGSGLLDGLVALRPVWWLLRAWALYQLVSAVVGTAYFEVLPFSGSRWFVLLAFLVVSVQWGRGRWLPRRWLRTVKVVVSAVAVLTLLVAIPSAVTSVGQQSAGAAAYYPPSGLLLDGEQVGNIFAYGADGEPLTDVQLFDQDGEPLDLVGRSDPSMAWTNAPDGMSILVPSGSVPGRVGWNVYPLSEAYADLGYEMEPDGAIDPDDTEPASPPFSRVQPLAAGEERADAAVPAPAASDRSATPSPSPSP